MESRNEGQLTKTSAALSSGPDRLRHNSPGLVSAPAPKSVLRLLTPVVALACLAVSEVFKYCTCAAEETLYLSSCLHRGFDTSTSFGTRATREAAEYCRGSTFLHAATALRKYKCMEQGRQNTPRADAQGISSAPPAECHRNAALLGKDAPREAACISDMSRHVSPVPREPVRAEVLLPGKRLPAALPTRSSPRRYCLALPAHDWEHRLQRASTARQDRRGRSKRAAQKYRNKYQPLCLGHLPAVWH